MIVIDLHERNWRQVRHNSKSKLMFSCSLVANKHDEHDYIYRQFAGVKSHDEFISKINKLNYFYAAVYQDDKKIVVAVDQIRSIPLFYGRFEGRLYVSDSAEWVRTQVNDTEVDESARKEFQLTGYITGSDTLYANVKQLQAGEILIAEERNGQVNCQCLRYYKFSHYEPKKFNDDELKKELRFAVSNTIDRLIKFASGRQIVIPLSGGYDSRLIATLLKEKKYTNVLAFTYGEEGNPESSFSKIVADSLNIEWKFIKTGAQEWAENWHKPLRKEYQQFASGHTSLPHIQDLLGVQKLKKNKLTQEDAIFVPGHSGDFVAGSHIPQEAFFRSEFTRRDVIESIFKYHYAESSFKLFRESKDFWLNRIDKRVSVSTVNNSVNYADAYECWDWQERQAKFITNSVRVYEFFGYAWWLPLWDVEYINFWQNVPLSLRKGREWYNEFVRELYAEVTGLENGKLLNNAVDPKYPFLFKNKITRKIPMQLKKIYMRMVRQKHPFISSSYPEKVLNELYRLDYRVNGMLSYFFLEEFYGKSNKER